MKSYSPIVVVVSALLLVACGESQDSANAEPSLVETYMADAEALSRGEALYIGSCASYCHDDSPEGYEPVDLFDCEWIHPHEDQDIFDIVTTGVPGTRMVGFGSNFPEDESDLWKLIAYLRSNQQACEEASP